MKSNKIIELFEKEFGPNGNFINIHDQKKYIKQLEEDFAAGKQVLDLIHSGAEVGKSFLIYTVKEAIKSNKKTAVLACPTGSAAIMLD